MTPPRPGDPITVGPLRLRNRIVFPAHLTNAAVGEMPTAQHAAYYAARAEGGAALVITEEHSAGEHDRPYEKLVRGTDPAIVPGLRRITDAVHAHDAAVLAQVGHNGGQSSSRYSGVAVTAPSPLPDPMFREVPRALTPRDLDDLVAGFARTAEHCVAGGYDGVEIQCSQASVVRQFLSPVTNHRDDDYGEDPARLLVEILAAVRAVLGPDQVLGVRLQGDEGLAGGLGAADAARVALRVEGAVDYVNTAVGVATATLPLIEPPMGVPAGYAAAVPTAVRAAVSVPVIGVGRFTTPEHVAATLAGGSCDLVGVTRGQIADPSFARRAVTGARVRRCVGCNQECIGAVGLGRRLGCVVNPRAGREAQPLPPPRARRRVLVAGGGPAGLAAAVTAAGRGHEVELVEAGDVLGGQVVWAASAPGRSELGHAVEDLITDLGAVWVSVGTRVDVALIADRAPDVVVDATGSEAAAPSWGADGVLDVEHVLRGRATPTGRVLVVDEAGGHAAPSTAELLARRGAAVTTVTSALVAAGDLGPTLEGPRWARRAAALGIVQETGRVVLGIEGRMVRLLDHVSGVEEQREVDAVVAAVPRRARGLVVPAGPAVVRIGDALAPRLLDAAVREGHDAAVELG
ncbi:FAD-dependent oxidoreductase [Actinomycetospora endophytica]|uniref:FAD-dependent oxidoreductase n=1 Tax=Actinomycetospora endophytica TaxID=2291215 RepID=A0ABS8P7E3_9PSEU|nr:FAD-dependent oxidoreductase [Actinomycetospora endophytica]MCD2194190.1 FAD-dependent oxidoreductase [Actinomycetospora endophytica]